MPEMPRSNRRRFGIGRTLSILAILAVLILASSYIADRRLPRHEGRSVRAWFHQFCRAGSIASGVYEDARVYDAKVAFLEMGTNAVPYLVQQAFAFRKDTALRTNLHNLFLHFPEWAGRGNFVSYGQVNFRATELLRAMKPPARVLLPLLEPHLRSPVENHLQQAYFLLGGVDDDAEAVVPLLLQAATTSTTNAWTQGIAWQSLRWLGTRASNALPPVLQELTERSRFANDFSHQAWFQWLAELGPAAAPAIPVIQSFVAHTNARTRIGAAVALTYIDPQNTAARHLLGEAAVASPGNTTFTDLHEALCNAVTRSPRRENDLLASILEPLARAEAQAWGPRGGSFRVINALERVSPARAALLYESLLVPPGPATQGAAQAMLRVDRHHEAAAKILVDSLAGNPAGAAAIPLWALGEASSSNRVAMAALKEVVSGRFQPDPAHVSRGNWKRQVGAAKASLARIRYREARAARGLPEGDWW